MMAVAGVLVGTAVLSAQPPQGGRGPQGQERPEMKLPEVLSPEEKTALMAQDYNLTPEQEKAVLELNKQFDGKLDFRPEGFGPDKEMKDPRQMSEAERRAFFEKMQDRMGGPRGGFGGPGGPGGPPRGGFGGGGFEMGDL